MKTFVLRFLSRLLGRICYIPLLLPLYAWFIVGIGAAAFATPLHVDLVVDAALLPEVSGSLETYSEDLRCEGYAPTIFSYDERSVSPEDLRNHLKTRWVSGALDGTVFIGDFPAPTFEMKDSWRYESFPIDLFYMDLDGSWADIDRNGVFDDHSAGSGDVAPDIWFGRITTSTLGKEKTLVNDYFRKNHDYRLGKLTFDKAGLLYIDDDWSIYGYDWESDVQQVYPGATTLINDPYVTNAGDYKSRLASGNYESLLQAVHSNPFGMAFQSPNGTDWVYNWEIPGLNPHIAYYNFFDCCLANYTVQNYMAGKYIFETDYGLAGVGSAKVGSMLDFDIFYGFLKDMTMGQAFSSWFAMAGMDGFQDWERDWYYGMTLLGDPTLGPSFRPYSLPVPEPSTLLLLSFGLAGIIRWNGSREPTRWNRSFRR